MGERETGARVRYCVAVVSDALLTLLKWCLLALMYLFFFRVLQATWFSTTGSRGIRRPVRREQAVESGESRSGRGRVSVVNKRPSLPELVFVEPIEMAGTTHTVNGTLTIGRAAGCEITLDDTYISQVHARVSVGESGVVVEDLGSTNGTYLNRRRVSTPVVVSEGDAIQIGSTIMELR